MQSLHFSRIPNFSKQLNFLQELFFQKMLFFWTATFLIANLSFTLSIDNLVINPTNTVVFRLKLLGGAQSAAPLKKSFHYIPWTKIFHQICFLRAVLNRMTIYLTTQKNSVFAIFNKNIFFSTESPKEPTIYNSLFLFVIS